MCSMRWAGTKGGFLCKRPIARDLSDGVDVFAEESLNTFPLHTFEDV